MFPVVISTDGGQTYTVQEEVAGLSQSASVFGDGNDIGLVGSFTNSNKDPAKHGVAYSSDAGATWTLSGINDFGTRNGAFPSKVFIVFLRFFCLLIYQPFSPRGS